MTMTLEALQEEVQTLRGILTQHPQGLPDMLARLAQSEQAVAAKMPRAEAEAHITALRVGLDQVSAQLQAQAVAVGEASTHHQQLIQEPIREAIAATFEKPSKDAMCQSHYTLHSAQHQRGTR